MPRYDFEQWRVRHRQRVDISASVTHLTRPAVIDNVQKTAVEVLIKILRDGVINGSTRAGYVVGSRPAVCFQDAPLLGLAQNVDFERENAKRTGQEPRYAGVGIAFSKAWIFDMGGRPVIYDKTDHLKEILPASEHWRIVRLDLSDANNIVDWSHEREWRVPGSVQFSVADVVIVVEHASDYREFREKAPDLFVAVHAVTALAHALA